MKGYHECPFPVQVGQRFTVQKKRGDRGNAFRVMGDRGQVGHLQRNLVAPLWQLKNDILGAGGGINVPVKIETVLGSDKPGKYDVRWN